MSHKSAEISDKITVLVFKDNFASRTFQIPLKWISKLGIFVGLILVIALSSCILTLKSSIFRSKEGSAHVTELEQEVVALKENIKNLEKRATDPASNKAESNEGSSSSILFSAFPSSLSKNVPDPATLHFIILNPVATWQDETLRVRFALQYRAVASEESDSQEVQRGKIVILARGQDTLLAYPPGVLGRAGAKSLIVPDEGESFSMTRYREVKADFGPVSSQDALQDVEIYIFSNNNQLLAYQKLSPQGSAK